MKGQLSSLSDRGFLATAAMLAIGAFVLRVWQLGREELWLDEALSFYAATGPLDLSRIFLAEYTPPLYELLLRWWVSWAGSGEGSLRMLSALFGTLFVPAIIWAGTVFFNKRVGLWAGAFAMIAPVHIYYSQEARAYALLILLLTVTGVLLWRALELQTHAAWVLATTTGILALYTHYFAGLALFPMVGMVFLPQHRHPAKQNRHQLAGAIAVCGMAYAPLLYWHFVHTNHSRGELNWIRSIWEGTPPLLAIPKTLEVFWLGGQAGLLNLLIKAYPLVTFPAPLRILGLLLLVGLGLWVAMPWKDPTLQIPSLRERKIWLWMMLLFPLIVLWLVSFYHPLYAVGRYDFVTFPAFTLLVGLAFAKLQGAGRAGSLLVCCVALVFTGLIGTKLVHYYQAPPRPIHGRPSARTTAAALLSIVKDGDLVVFTGLRGLPVLYYLSREGLVWAGGQCENRRTGRHFGCRMFPIEMENAPATVPRAHLSDPLQAVREDVQSILSTGSENGGILWIVFGPGGYREGKLQVSELDPLLLQELHRLGFQFAPTEAPGVVAFKRPDAFLGMIRRGAPTGGSSEYGSEASR